MDLISVFWFFFTNIQNTVFHHNFYFVFTVAKKFDIPTLDLKVFDVTKTEVDEEVFEFLIQKQDLGVLEICLPQDPNGEFLSILEPHIYP